MGRKPKNRMPKRRGPTAGSFRPGPDPRRHRFTTEECRRGYLAAVYQSKGDANLAAWVSRKVRASYGGKHKPGCHPTKGFGGPAEGEGTPKKHPPGADGG